jgi:hypothetical protein
MFMSVAALATALLASCRKEPLDNLTEEESRIYVTNHDSTINFSTYATFSIVDSVAVISNSGAKKELTTYDQQLIASVKSQLEARGYVAVSKEAKPDLAVNLSRIDNTSYSAAWTPGYWSGWPGYWDAGYWGYPGYGYYWPSYYTVFRTRERSVSIDMLDLKNGTGKEQLTAVWNAMLRGSGVWNSNNINSMVKAVFDQSAYLQTNK